ncbi:MAG TPA: hypothetical protein PLH25_03135, partial [Flavobacterium sp.]|nr:hypothetical protein [Flavobacterium sp.]
MKKIYLHITILFLILIGNWCFAQTTCTNAVSITINGTCLSGTVSDNMQNAPNTGTTCTTAGAFRRERWYTFIVTSGPQDITITAE